MNGRPLTPDAPTQPGPPRQLRCAASALLSSTAPAPVPCSPASSMPQDRRGHTVSAPPGRAISAPIFGRYRAAAARRHVGSLLALGAHPAGRHITSLASSSSGVSSGHRLSACAWSSPTSEEWPPHGCLPHELYVSGNRLEASSAAFQPAFWPTGSVGGSASCHRAAPWRSRGRAPGSHGRRARRNPRSASAPLSGFVTRSRLFRRRPLVATLRRLQRPFCWSSSLDHFHLGPPFRLSTGRSAPFRLLIGSCHARAGYLITPRTPAGSRPIACSMTGVLLTFPLAAVVILGLTLPPPGLHLPGPPRRATCGSPRP